MSSDTTGFVCVCVIGLAVCLAFAFAGYDSGRYCTRRQAINHAVAEWRCDPATGKTEFVWLGAEDAE